jgi:hypothetical protein
MVAFTFFYILTKLGGLAWKAHCNTVSRVSVGKVTCATAFLKGSVLGRRKGAGGGGG